MAKIISDTWAGPDHPIYREPLQSYNPHWARALLKSKKAQASRDKEQAKRFRMDDTEGYVQADLDALNAAYDEFAEGAECGSWLDDVAKEILSEYDAGKRGDDLVNAIGIPWWAFCSHLQLRSHCQACRGL